MKCSCVYLGFSLQTLDWRHNFHRSQINNVQYSHILHKHDSNILHGAIWLSSKAYLTHSSLYENVAQPQTNI